MLGKGIIQTLLILVFTALVTAAASAQQLNSSAPTECETLSYPGRFESQISQAEYAQLQMKFEELAGEVENLKRAASSNPNQIALVPDAQYAEPHWARAMTPGWERSRNPNWMGLGRRQRMTTQIARTGNMNLFLGLNTVGRVQYLQQYNVFDTVVPNSVVTGPLEPGIQTPFGQFSLLADFDGAMEVYFDIYIATRPHEDLLQADEGFLLLRQLPGPLGENSLVNAFFERANVKFGAFEIDYGDHHYRRSNNADVQRNPLIGNYVIDPRTTDIGAEIFSVPGAHFLNWLVGVGVGNTGDFQAERGWQFHGKLYGNSYVGLRPSVSFFWADHAGNPTGFPNSGSKSDLFRSNRSGGPYEDVFAAGNAPGQVTPGNGQNVAAVEFDLTWQTARQEIFGYCGMVQDSDTNGSAAGTPTESWMYYATEGVYRFTPRAYMAARYSAASALHLVSSADNSRDVPSDGTIHRFQVGGGYWLHETILAKLEYVHEFAQGFTADASQASGIDVWRDPSFYGVLMEISFAF